MPLNLDHSETRACLIRAVEALDMASCAARQTNLPPTRDAASINKDLERLERMIERAGEEVSAARASTHLTSRLGLRVVATPQVPELAK